MKLKSYVGGLLILLSSTGSGAYDQYYYGTERRIPLKIDSTKVSLKLDQGMSSGA